MIDLAPLHLVPHGNDWTPAFNAAVKAATEHGESIQFPAGRLRFASKPDPMGCGIMLRGDAGITSAKLGTMIVADYDEPDPEAGFFTWDGSDPRGYKGTGGGIRDMSIYKLGDGNHSPVGGTAIKVICIDNDKYRAGWWGLRDVAVLAEDPINKKSAWDHVFLADGVKVKTEGVRWLTCSGFMCSGARGHTVWLRNVIHFAWVNGQVQGGHTVDPHTEPDGIRIEGADSQDMHFSGVSCYDSVNIRQCEQFTYTGLAKWLILNGRKYRSQEAGKVRRGIINAVGVDDLNDFTDHTIDRVSVTAV